MTARQPTNTPSAARTGVHQPARSPIRVLVSIVAASLVLTLAACGDDGDDDDASGSASASEPAGDEATETTGEPEADGAELTGEEAEIGDAFATVFDSSVPFDDKVALLEGGEAHREDHDGYVTAADGIGGITVEPTDVEIDGDTATVTYGVLFAGTEQYSDLTRDVTRVDGAWIVPTDSFCGFIAATGASCAGAG